MIPAQRGHDWTRLEVAVGKNYTGGTTPLYLNRAARRARRRRAARRRAGVLVALVVYLLAVSWLTATPLP